MTERRHILAEDLRVRGETISLYMALALLAGLFLLLLGISLGTILVMVLIVVVVIKVRQGQLLGSSVKVSDQQFQYVHGIACEAARRLDMSIPDVFVTQNPFINAYAIGFLGRKSVVLHSATVEAMNPEELRSIIGHELTHIKCEHTTWLALTSVKDQVHVPIVSDIMGFIFLFWSRKAEYTSDRGSLLASRDLVASISALAKVAIGRELFKSMNLEALFNQMHQVDQDDLANLAELFGSHPYLVRRINALKEFHGSGLYRSLVDGIATQSGDEPAQPSGKVLDAPDRAPAERGTAVGDNSKQAASHIAFHCSNCGHSARLSKSKVMTRAKRITMKCPKCKVSTIVELEPAAN